MPSLRDLELRHSFYYLRILQDADRTCRDGGEAALRGLAIVDAEWEHIQVGQRNAHRYLSRDKEAAKACSLYAGVGGTVRNIRQQARDRVAWLRAGLVAARRLGDEEAKGRHLSNLGTAYFDLDEIDKSLECHKARLKIARKLRDPKAEAYALGGLALVNAHQGHSREAVKKYKKAIELFRERGDWRGEIGRA